MLPNISQLNDYIWTGGDLHPAYINATKQMTHITDEGISVIIDTRYEWNDESLWAEHPDVDVIEAFNFVDPVVENYEGSMLLLLEGAVLAVWAG